MVGERRAQLAFEAVGQASAELEHALADQRDRLRRRAPVLAGVLHAGVDLVAQAGDAHHVELVEVRRVDRAELDALEQRHALVLGELQHAVVEVEPRELAVDVQRGLLQVARRALGERSATSSELGERPSALSARWASMCPSSYTLAARRAGPLKHRVHIRSRFVYSGSDRAADPLGCHEAMARQLWVLRHAEAEPHGTRSDSERRLTRARRAAGAHGRRRARAARIRPSRRCCSARRRALARRPSWRPSSGSRRSASCCSEHDALAAGFDGAQALDALAGLGADARLLIVGHEPDLSGVVADLTGGRIDLKKGGLAVVRLEGVGGELAVLMRPRELALIAGVPGGGD